MTYDQPPRAATRYIPALVFATAAVLNAAFIGVFAHPSSTAPRMESTPMQHPWTESAPDHDTEARLTVADGEIFENVSIFDDMNPAVANLDTELLAALRHAASDATSDGVEFVVNSGWRSAEYQEQLRREAVAEYGSHEEAARWVATPHTSAHVAGDAVDIGPSDATVWLSGHGAQYGLCQIYDNEPWHYELRLEAIDHGCPPLYADPTEDPRMWQ
jgi:uncharacterized protein YcbK (DUF882 family)